MGSKKKIIGKCRLCYGDNKELVRSHFLSSFVYDSMNQGKPPVAIKKTGVKYLSEQVTSRLFCKDCENNHFNKKGEQYVAKVSYRGKDPFPLEAILKQHNNICLRYAKFPSIREYNLDKIPEIDHSSLIYFGLSIVYRGAIWAKEYPNDFSLKLKDSTFDELRLFLLGQGEIPDLTTVQLIVAGLPETGSQPDLREVAFFPYRRGIDLSQELSWQGYTPIELLMGGLAYNIEIGDRVPDDVRNDSLYPARKIYRIPSNLLSLNQRALNALSEAVENTLWTPNGYLKK